MLYFYYSFVIFYFQQLLAILPVYQQEDYKLAKQNKPPICSDKILPRKKFCNFFFVFIFPIREQCLFRWWFFLLLFLSVWWLFGVLIFIYFLFTVDKFNLNLTPLPNHRSCFINAIYLSVRFFWLKIMHIIVKIY